MKNKIYELIVDIWRLAYKYNFQKLNDDTWQTFVQDGNRLHDKYRQYGKVIELLFRDLFSAVQNFYQRIGEK